MINFEKMSVSELENKLEELKDLFEEVTEERMIILGQENLHLSSKLVVKYENELNEIKGDVALTEGLLKSKLQ